MSFVCTDWSHADVWCPPVYSVNKAPSLWKQPLCLYWNRRVLDDGQQEFAETLKDQVKGLREEMRAMFASS